MEAVQRPFSAIASDYAIDEKTVRRIAKDRIPCIIGRVRPVDS